MKFFYRLLIPAIFLPLFSLAQGNYKQGFIINLKGDTTKGYIDLREWGTNPQNISFKQSLDKASQTLTVNDISVFELPGYAAYKSFVTSISLDETDIQKLEHLRDTTTRTDNVFLKIEHRGKNVTLYSYNDDLKERFYIYNSCDNSIAELTYRIYYVANDKNNVNTISQNAYKQQLALIAQKFDTYSGNLESQIEGANYNRAELIDICRKINGSGIIENHSHKKYIKFAVGAGLTYANINFTGVSPLYNTAKTYNSISPRIFVGFNFYPSPDVAKSVIKVDFAYSSASYKTSGNLYFYQPDIKSIYHFKQNTISFIPQFQYNIYNSDPFKFYLDAGLSVNFSTYSDNSVYNPVTKSTDTDFTGFNDKWLSAPVKAGIILNKTIDISVIFGLPVSISNNVAGHHQDFNENYKLTTITAGVSYIF
jgi:hypothetical protein